VPSFILIYLSVWPQYTNVADRRGQTDRTTVDSIRGEPSPKNRVWSSFATSGLETVGPILTAPWPARGSGTI